MRQAKNDRPKRVRLSPAQTAPKGHVNPYLKEQKKLVVDARAAFQVDPVTGVGMMLSPEGSPVLINLRRSEGTSAWVGEAMGDERSTVFVVSTKHGYVGTIWSRVWGSFYFLPDGIGQATIRSSKDDERGICGNGTEWERPIVEPQGTF